MRTFISILVIGIVIVALAYFLFGRDEEVRTTETATTTVEEVQELENTYESEQYGFAFSAPTEYEINAYTEEAVAVGTPNDEGGFDAVAEVLIAMSEGEGGYENFEAFLFESTSNMCAADGPNVTIYCDRLMQQQPFTTDTGLSGTVFYLNRVEEDLASGEKSEDVFGPIFAFNMQATTSESTYSALIVRPPANITAEDVESELVREVASSVEINAVE